MDEGDIVDFTFPRLFVLPSAMGPITLIQEHVYLQYFIFNFGHILELISFGILQIGFDFE